MLCKSAKDLEDPSIVGDPRMSYTIRIARVWFIQIEALTEPKISELKEFMDSHTFVGEYCGPDSPHIVKYDKGDIYYYCIVKKNSIEPCLHPLDSFAKFEYFNLPAVKHSCHSEYKEWDKLRADLIDISLKVALAPLKEE